MPEFRRLIVDGSIQTVEVEEGRFTAADGRRASAEDYPHLPPVVPRMIVCVHLSFRSRLDELKRNQPPAPTYFLKVVSSLNSHKANVVRPANCQFLNYEGEIALVVGRTCRNITPDKAADYVWGYTVANDMGLHDFRDTDENSMVRVKGSDTLGPIGPGLNTDWDFRGKMLRTYVDGKVVQEASTDDFIWDPHYMLADLSRSITLERGDVIMTGTPANSRPVNPGSTVVVEVEGLGRLENHVVSGDWAIPAGYGAQPSDSDGVQSIALGSDFRKA
ncbi:fumarylacetoacetate hydrolase family protein [Oceanibacterium hippocampi]|uniref:Homoprotocatechuate catabolism bifunctional isomerase/decarboxylase n=1 Tax=Oceanibacterium hippocampi TaxID=745714 RepID=A0A1Y5U017_9PROT|nr:fumarylacetoacetate hydrolase family protein [Oceanibacterium hippocampi]SLN77812.1 Homoprotocatechuate catabolism bifunctional isomerase/decarboxylase [Oceanibacterium hippocampi]